MANITYILQDPTGAKTQGAFAETGNSTLALATGQKLSVRLDRAFVADYMQSGEDMIVILMDGRRITLEGFFGPDGEAGNRLYVQEDNVLSEVMLTKGDDEFLYALYEESGAVGKWNPDDALIQMDRPEVVAQAAESPAWLKAGLALPLLGLVGGGAGVAGTIVDVIAQVVPITVNDDPIVIGGDDVVDPAFVVSGTAPEGSKVTVKVGGILQTVIADADGKWVAEFSGANFPDDGVYLAGVVVVPEGEAPVELGGPKITIDLTPPDLEVTDGVDATGDFFNAESHPDGVKLSGSGEAGAEVIVTIDGEEQTTTVANDGTWSVVFSSDQVAGGDYETEVSIKTIDSFGNSATFTETVVIDTIPAAVSVNTVAGDDLVNAAEHTGGVVLTGTAEAGSTLVIEIKDVVTEVAVGADGTWTLALEQGDLPEGQYEATVTATTTDVHGNTNSTTHVVQVDTVSSVAFSNDPVTIDDVVNAAEVAGGVMLSGTTLAGSTVEVTMGSTTRSANVKADGSWTVKFIGDEFAGGEYGATVTAVATSAVGNISSATKVVQVDTIAALTIDPDPITADDVVNAVEAASGVTLTGTTEIGATVQVTLGGATKIATVDANGNWSAVFMGADIPSGQYSADVFVTATDMAGNTQSLTDVLTIDTETGVTLASPIESDGVINGVEASDGVVLSGSGEPGASVQVTMNGVTHSATVSNDGGWSATFLSSEIPSGEYVAPIKVVSIDPAGNVATATADVSVDTFVNRLEILPKPIAGDGYVNAEEAANGFTVTGVTEPGSTLVAQMGGVKVQADVAADGSWTASFAGGSIPAGEYTTSLTATATDAAGNTRSTSEQVRIDTDAGYLTLSPDPIEIDDIINGVEASDGTVIQGTATPGAVVTVTLGDATTDTVSDAAGNWTAFFSASQIPQGTYVADITASITDVAGNFKMVSDTVNVDTQVDNLSISAAPVEGDDVVNAAEADDGVVLTGTTEIGSSLIVTLGSVSKAATVDANGNWVANFAVTDIPAGEYSTTITATATDIAGNVATVTDTVAVDTLVNDLTITAPIEGDNIVGAAEAADGVTLTGTVEKGSSVVIGFAGMSRSGTVDAAGNWSVTFAASEIPDGQYDAGLTVTAMDAAGNTRTETESVSVDTVSPDAPLILSFTKGLSGVRSIGSEMSDDTLDIQKVDASGQVSDVAYSVTENPGFNELTFNFQNPIPDGSHLVVTREDAAGNASGTLFVLEDTQTSVVDLTNPGLKAFDIESVDLQFASDAQLTITEEQLLNLSTANNSVTVHGSIDDTVTALGATKTGEVRQIEGQNYDVYSFADSGASLIIDDEIKVII